jgi:hypothetical protein
MLRTGRIYKKNTLYYRGLQLLTSCRSASYLSAAASACGVSILDSLKDTYTPVKFDHPKHVSIAGNCSACHHEHGIADGLPCKQCHALTPLNFKNSVNYSFMACKSSHTTADRDNWPLCRASRRHTTSSVLNVTGAWATSGRTPRAALGSAMPNGRTRSAWAQANSKGLGGKKILKRR